MRLKPIKTRKAYREIIDQVKELIESGELQPGEKLPSERELGELLEVSRPTVREALTALEMVDLVESRPGEGRYIKASTASMDRETLDRYLTDSKPFELLEARITIEAGTAYIAAGKAEKRDLEQLKDKLSRMSELVEAGGMALDADSDFHFMIARITRNKFLIKTMEHIVVAMNSEGWKQLKREAMSEQQVREKYLKDHTQIYQAISEGRGEKAGLYMQAHLTKVWSDLLPENGQHNQEGG